MGKTTPIELTEKQVNWLTKHFKNTKNAVLAAKLGISESTLHRYARKLGLTKTRQFMTKCQLATSEAAKLSHRINGTYPPKGYIIPGSEQHRFKPGETSRQRLGKKREEARIAKSAATRKETYKKEHARVVFGLPQRTKLRVIRAPRKKILQRYYLKKRGYILDEVMRIAYWTEDTQRSMGIEKRPKNFYKFSPLKSETEIENVNGRNNNGEAGKIVAM